MTNTNPNTGLRALHDEIGRFFAFVNARHFDGLLPEPVYAWEPQPRNGHRLGHFAPQSWREGTGEDAKVRDEIVLYSDLCFKAGMGQVLQTLAHEMCHLADAEERRANGKKMPKNNAAWHGKRFREIMARIGLKAEGPKGITSPLPAFEAMVAEFAPRVEGIPFRTQNGGDGEPKVGKMKKWSCPCGVNVRVGAAEFSATCNLCGGEFTLQEV